MVTTRSQAKAADAPKTPKRRSSTSAVRTKKIQARRVTLVADLSSRNAKNEPNRRMSSATTRSQADASNITTRRSCTSAVQAKKIQVRRVTLASGHPTCEPNRRLSSVTTRSQAKAADAPKTPKRRNSTSAVQANKIQVRRVTLASGPPTCEPNRRLSSAHQQSLKPMQKNPDLQNAAARGLSTANQIQLPADCRGVVVRLNRLDLSKFKRQGSYYLLPTQNDAAVASNQAALNQLPAVRNQDSGNEQSVIQICRNCASTFDAIFEEERSVYIAPYIDLLEREKQANLVASQLLEVVENQWKEESQKYWHLANEIDKVQDEVLGLTQKNNGLRLRIEPFSNAVMDEHCYSVYSKFNKATY